jgi:SAM-dependent methyltransferase
LIEAIEDLYSYPMYYEIAFSFRDIKHEVDVFEDCISKYSRISVRRVLELGCGTAPHLNELTRRGYKYVGLDINEKMLRYARSKGEASRTNASFLQGDMRHFSLEEPVDFAYVMLGSLYAETTRDLNMHLESIGRVVKPGGLYFLDWCINFDWDSKLPREQKWTIEQQGTRVDCQFISEVAERATQTCRNRLLAEVHDHGRTLHLGSTENTRTVFPQEFLLLIEKQRVFEFVGWWNNWNLAEPIEKATHIERPIALIRRI